MSKRRPKNGYCTTCGTALKRPPAYEQSCTIRCAANAWYGMVSFSLDNWGYCRDCGEYADCCECVSVREKYLQEAEAFGYVPCDEEE